MLQCFIQPSYVKEISTLNYTLKRWKLFVSYERDDVKGMKFIFKICKKPCKNYTYIYTEVYSLSVWVNVIEDMASFSVLLTFIKTYSWSEFLIEDIDLINKKE